MLEVERQKPSPFNGTPNLHPRRRERAWDDRNHVRASFLPSYSYSYSEISV